MKRLLVLQMQIINSRRKTKQTIRTEIGMSKIIYLFKVSPNGTSFEFLDFFKF